MSPVSQNAGQVGTARPRFAVIPCAHQSPGRRCASCGQIDYRAAVFWLAEGGSWRGRGPARLGRLLRWAMVLGLLLMQLPAPTAIRAQGTTCRPDVEPNNTEAEVEKVSGGFCIAGDLPESSDQDLFLWTVTADDAHSLWTITVSGPEAVITDAKILTLYVGTRRRADCRRLADRSRRDDRELDRTGQRQLPVRARPIPDRHLANRHGQCGTAGDHDLPALSGESSVDAQIARHGAK